MIGIGGVSMSALARLLRDRGVRVRGCDARASAFTDMLVRNGIPVCIGREEIAEGTVVYTEAVDVHGEQLGQAKRAGKRLLSRAELLGRIAEEYPCVLSVAGSHGKTSATSMLAHVLMHAGQRFTCHIGGEDRALGNYFTAGDEVFLTEACEFRRSFLRLRSDIAVILNTDLDHTDCYRSRGELLKAYAQFAASAASVVVNADDPGARTLPHALSFGRYAGDIRAVDLFEKDGKFTFTVAEGGVPVVRIALRVFGQMQTENALAAYAAAKLYGISPQTIKEGLEHFYGVKRRFEPVGSMGGIPVVCDYAHHPREIAAAYAAARAICSGTVRTVFQPHTYTRTRDLLEEFAAVLKTMESPVVYRTYAAREEYLPEGSAVTLASRVPEALYVQSPQNLKKRLTELCRADDLILVLGAGDIYDVVLSLTDDARRRA